NRCHRQNMKTSIINGSEVSRLSVAIHFKAAIDQFFTVTLPEIAGSLASRINDNFQVLKPASSS
ncbi:hypothetical protein P3S44_25075, partial [Enterobacter hormaechei]|nr:hypothetical protein [Enterobacter hormaechei]MDF3670207.1 hypothetical protein [Enterobacter hormaechei]MDM3084436.1 hypothetical protein [Citrobacter sp. Cf141]